MMVVLPLHHAAHPVSGGRYFELSVMISGLPGAMQAKTDGRAPARHPDAAACIGTRWAISGVTPRRRPAFPTVPGLNVNDRAAIAPDGRPQRVSDLLVELASTWPHERVSLGDVTQLLGERGYGVLMLVLALPGAVPGVASIAAIPLALVALQLAIGLPRPWLPRFLAARSLSRTEFARMVERVAPHLSRIERLLRPRLVVLTGPVGERVIGVACLVLALLLTVPILFNWPLVVPIALMALGVLERDGVFAVIGFAVGCIVLGTILGVGWVSIQEGLQLAGKYLGM